MTERERNLQALLLSVVAATEAERAAQMALDTSEAEYVVNQSNEDVIHQQLRESVKTARRALKDARKIAEQATADANAYLNKKAVAA